MANPRQLDNRRKSIRNIRKITRTMELIATARFKKAMDRASAATAYTDRITALVKDLARAGLRLEEAEYRRKLDESLISREVFNDLQRYDEKVCLQSYRMTYAFFAETL